MGVDLGGPGALMTEEFLDDAKVGAAFQEVGGEAVSESVSGDILLDSSGRGGILHHSLNRAGGEVTVRTVAGKEPSVGGVGIPVDAERFDSPVSQKSVAVLPALTPSDQHQTTLHVEIPGLETHDLPHPEAGGIEEKEKGSVFRVPGLLEHPCHLSLAEYGGKVPVPAGPGNP
jgi:hypothetical protein